MNNRLSGMASAASATLPAPFSLRGLSTVIDMGSSCFGACFASKGHCDCLQLSGVLSASVLGNSSFAAAIGLNLDDCASTPDGDSCCPADGSLDAIKGNNELTMALFGSYCRFTTNTATTLWKIFGMYRIVPSPSRKGSLKSAFGTGSISIDANVQTTESGALLSATGNVLR